MDDGITLRNCFGYLNERMAYIEGFTHHGSYYGIPIWITDEECPMVAAKWAPLEYVIELSHLIEGFLLYMLYQDEEPVFMFKILRPIKQEGARE